MIKSSLLTLLCQVSKSPTKTHTHICLLSLSWKFQFMKIQNRVIGLTWQSRAKSIWYFSQFDINGLQKLLQRVVHKTRKRPSFGVVHFKDQPFLVLDIDSDDYYHRHDNSFILRKTQTVTLLILQKPPPLIDRSSSLLNTKVEWIFKFFILVNFSFQNHLFRITAKIIIN